MSSVNVICICLPVKSSVFISSSSPRSWIPVQHRDRITDPKIKDGTRESALLERPQELFLCSSPWPPWSHPAHLGPCWSRSAHLGLCWSRPAHLGPRWSYPVSRSLEASRAPTPLPFRCYTARDAPIGRGGNVRLCLPLSCVSLPLCYVSIFGPSCFLSSLVY